MIGTGSSSGILATGFWDKAVLDEWQIPFGLWIEEIVFWLTKNIGIALDAIKWPVDQLLSLVIDNLLQSWLPWPLVLALFLLLGLVTRNFWVGLGSAAALLVCGLLGNDYWDLTMETVGMIIVSVIICAAIGIPLGVLAARVDSFWNRLRPILDGMQVIHPFVYLLPIIFLFGVRRTPGVLATLVFALPPIVRLTNLGIRQVPEDVVEAARAFGATDRRILREVQLPLARPAIMAGLNQTLLLSLSMVGIVAIIAGGGLGKPILTALNTADIPIGASAGAGLYFVGVLLDRISQPEDADGDQSLFGRIRDAWANRSDPQVPPLPMPADQSIDGEHALTEEAEAEARQRALLLAAQAEVVEPRARQLATVAIAGSLVSIVSAFLAWSSGAARLSSYARIDDTDLPGSHSGIAATGGSWFGIGVLTLAAIVLLITGSAALGRPLLRTPTRHHGAVLALGLGLAATVAGFLTVSVRGDNYQNAYGVWVALLGAALVLAAGVLGSLGIHTPAHEAKLGLRYALTIIVLTAFLCLAGATGSWILDQRSDAAQTAAEMAAEAAEGGAAEGGVAAEILAEAMAGTRRVSIGGLSEDGPQLGFIVIALSLLGGLVALARMATGASGQRLLALVVAGSGLALVAVSIGWIGSMVRIDTDGLTPGASAFLTLCGGLILAAQGWRGATHERQIAN